MLSKAVLALALLCGAEAFLAPHAPLQRAGHLFSDNTIKVPGADQQRFFEGGYGGGDTQDGYTQREKGDGSDPNAMANANKPASLQWSGEASGGETGNYRRLSDRLKDADIEQKKADEEQYKREHASEMARQEHEATIAFMESMPDDTPAGMVNSALD